MSSSNAGREWRLLFEHNVLGVYAAAADYWTDGVDRFMGWYPGCIAYAGGPEEADKFVKLFRDIVRALPEQSRANAALLALNLVRHGQKCVKTEVDFMSGKAQHPVLRFADIDATKVVDAAAKMSLEAPCPITPFLNQDKTRALSDLPVTDLWGWPSAADCSCYAMSAYHAAFFARGGEQTFRCVASLYPVKRGKFVWKVLQGDEKKVRILPKAVDKSEVELEVDYHEAFDVTLADGTKQKTSRVDVGCFLVGTNGVASVPAIVSVYFSPNETREYGKDGKLVSIDYTKRQIEAYCPNLCPKGDWKDVFRWTDDGRLSGWTRACADGQGRVTTKTLKRMKFCKWTPATNDIWKVETDLAQLLKEKVLWELADGSCRFENASVNDTYRTLNLASEVLAYEALDRNYRRCKSDEVKQLFARVPEEGWADYLIVEGEYVFDDELPPEKKRTITAWRIGDGIHFCIDANRRDGAYFRRYFFRTQDKETGEGATYSLSGLPSLAIGNTVLAAERGDPVALNNLAVLMYAEIVNPGEYSEEAVTVLLEALARAGNATATYNLGVMAENCGEKGLAARRYAEAQVPCEKLNLGLKE